jgi:hypothetical protein
MPIMPILGLDTPANLRKQWLQVSPSSFPRTALFEPLKDAGYSVEIHETFRLPNEDELIEKLADNVVATIAGGEPYTVEALQHNRIGGAGLDVFEVEPLPADSPLRSLDNVLLSAHVSGVDQMAKRKVTERCVSNILIFLSGQKDAIRPYTVNPETLMENSK